MDQPEVERGHDVIVIGASAGGVEALSQVVRALPADLPASLFVVLHVPPFQRSMLPEILSRLGPLPASHAIHGETIQLGHIYIAPPDNHLLLQDGRLRVIRGPRENGHRPASDPLFRSAAQTFGPRVVGVVLTGNLDCGTAGLLAIKARGGLAVVQDPAEAIYNSMPSSAIEHVAIDHVLPVAEIGPLLARLAREPVAGASNGPVGAALPAEQRSAVTCPECHGSMMEAVNMGLLQFHCHVGHAYSAETMATEQAEALEAALWAAVRALEESQSLARRLATAGDRSTARDQEQARTYQQHADLIRSILLAGPQG